MSTDPDIRDISGWRSILTLIVFIISNCAALFRFHIPLHFPRIILHTVFDGLTALRIIPPRESTSFSESNDGETSSFVRWRLPINLTTGPLLGVLFLLATTAIGRKEVKEGTLGANNINPMDIMAFAFTIGYVSSAIDATGLIRYLNFKILQRYARSGRRLYVLLYVLFFLMGCFFGNDPVIQMGMLMLTYMTKMAANIAHPRAWIHTQFAISNIASAIFVSSNTTNVIIAQAFKISFAAYTVNLIVPVLAAAVLMMPFMLFVAFANQDLIPWSINIHELPEGEESRPPIPPSIPYKDYEWALFHEADERDAATRLSQVMNPALDKASAAFGIAVMFTTLIVLMALTAANLDDVPVFWATLPAAFTMLCWDVIFGWIYRHQTRTVVRNHHLRGEALRASGTGRRASQATSCTETQAAVRVESSTPASMQSSGDGTASVNSSKSELSTQDDGTDADAVHFEVSKEIETWCGDEVACREVALESRDGSSEVPTSSPPDVSTDVSIGEADGQDQVDDEQSMGSGEKTDEAILPVASERITVSEPTEVQGTEERIDTAQSPSAEPIPEAPRLDTEATKETSDKDDHLSTRRQKRTLMSLILESWGWLQNTLPRVTLVVAHLPFSLILFVFPTFILVQALVSTGWITAFAHGWNGWISKTGTVGAVVGMGFLSVVLSNFAGTNIGATVLLSRVLQIWLHLSNTRDEPVSERTLWGAVYALAIGVNYGAFSIAFAASLAGLGWREDLLRKGIEVQNMEFFRVNLSLIIVAMVVSCSILVAEVYLSRTSSTFVTL